MGMLTTTISLSAGLIAGLALTPLSVVLARRWGVLDLPGTRKVHTSPTPRLGGIAIALATIIGAAIALLTAAAQPAESSALLTLLLVSLFVLGVGIADDLFNIRSNFKLLALIAAAITVCGAGVRIDAIILNGREAIPLGWWGWLLTIAWIVGITVSINFIDGLDGLAGGIAAIACGLIALTASLHNVAGTAILSLALLGSLIGFLVFNFSPARVFMGDGGSMFVGFTLATLTVLQQRSVGTTTGLMLPALALAVPLLDTALTVVRRSVIHRSLFTAEREHIHHRLLVLGLCPKHAVYVLYGASLLSAGVGVLALMESGWATIAGLAILVPLLLGLFRTAGSTRVRETISAIRRNRATAKASRRYQLAFDELLPKFRDVHDFSSWWEVVCQAGDALDCAAISLPITRRNGSTATMRWMRDQPIDGPTMSIVIPVEHRRRGDPLEVRVELSTHNHLEVAGQRVALLSRLLGEHHLAGLPDSTRRIKSLGPKVNDATAAHVNGHAGGNGSGADLNLITDVNPAGSVVTNGKKARSTWSPWKRRKPAVNGIHASLTSDAKECIEAGGRPKPRVAVVHDFLYCYAGAERVLEQILHEYPDAQVFALFDFLPSNQRSFIGDKTVRTSFIQSLPLARRKHRLYLPLMPLAIEQLDVSEFDIVISSSYLAAKGVLTRGDQLHVCYCHTPVRFAWDLQNQYLGRFGLISGLKSLIARMILHYIRMWDIRSANGVDVFLTNSDYVGRRIHKVYNRKSTTVYPPVDTERFTVHAKKEDFYLTASRLVPYKRVELIVRAFNDMPEKRLIVVGDGPEFEKIKAIAGSNVRMVGHQPFERLKQYMQLARAFVFAAEEDFGIVPVEAQACGTPVIAYGRGGVTESVCEGKTGVFFHAQTPMAISEAVRRFESASWDPEAIRAHAQSFSVAAFRQKLAHLVNQHWASFSNLRDAAMLRTTEPDAQVESENRLEERIGALTSLERLGIVTDTAPDKPLTSTGQGRARSHA